MCAVTLVLEAKVALCKEAPFVTSCRRAPVMPLVPKLVKAGIGDHIYLGFFAFFKHM